jgi:hypothetical protein
MTNYVNWWPAIVFGWPVVLLAIVLSVLGIIKKIPLLLVVSAVFLAPFSLYLGGSPRVGWLGFMIPVLLLGTSVAVRYRRVEIAWLLLVPVVAVLGWVASIVIGE